MRFETAKNPSGFIVGPEDFSNGIAPYASMANKLVIAYGGIDNWHAHTGPMKTEHKFTYGWLIGLIESACNSEGVFPYADIDAPANLLVWYAAIWWERSTKEEKDAALARHGNVNRFIANNVRYLNQKHKEINSEYAATKELPEPSVN